MSLFTKFCDGLSCNKTREKVLDLIERKYTIKPEASVTNYCGVLVVDLLVTLPNNYKELVGSLLKDLSNLFCTDLHVTNTVLDYTDNKFICSLQISTEKF